MLLTGIIFVQTSRIIVTATLKKLLLKCIKVIFIVNIYSIEIKKKQILVLLEHYKNFKCHEQKQFMMKYKYIAIILISSSEYM